MFDFIKKILAPITRFMPQILALVFIGAIISYTVTYTVRFTETAVVTTFGKAGENSIKSTPGLRFKAPYPFQSVTKYDTRVRLVQTRSETQQTADDFQVVVEAFMTYRVSDPLQFYRSFSGAGDRAIDHFRSAEDTVLRDLLRSSLGSTSQYRMDELFTPELGGSKLTELEGVVLTSLRAGGEGNQPLSEYGIEITSVGIDRVVMPESVTSAVIDRMGAGRDLLAETYESEGRAIATQIEASAQSDAERIRAFAQRRADEIRAQGEREAAEFLALQRGNEQLAVFLQKMDFMRSAMAKRFTLILPAEGLLDVVDQSQYSRLMDPSRGDDAQFGGE